MEAPVSKTKARMLDAIQPRLNPDENIEAWVYCASRPEIGAARYVRNFLLLGRSSPGWSYLVLTDRRFLRLRDFLEAPRLDWDEDIGTVRVRRYTEFPLIRTWILTLERRADGMTIVHRGTFPWRANARLIVEALGRSR
jgi:hypothetical protein